MKDTPRIYRFGPFEFDPSQQELRGPELRATLPQAVNRLLLLFVTRPGELITRDDIAMALWQDHHIADTTNRINTAIRRLRDQLAEVNPEQVWIETVVGAGYRLNLAVDEIQETNPEASSSSPPHLAAVFQPAAAPHSRFALPRLALIACIVVVLVAAAVAFLHRSARSSKSPADVSAKVLNQPFIARIFPITFNEPDQSISAQAISPDGDLVAYSDPSGVSLETVDSQTVSLLVSPPGLEVDRISWFPDQRRLLISGTTPHSTRPDTWIVYLTGQPPRLLLNDAGFASVSPDGRRIAFLRTHRTEVWLADADGQNLHQRVAPASGDTFSGPLWSPDGARIVVDRDTTTPRQTLESPVDAARGPLDQLHLQHRWIYESRNAETGALLAQREGLQFDSAVLLSDGRMIYPFNPPGDKTRLAVLWTDPASGAILSTQPPPPDVPPADYYGSYASAHLSASDAGLSSAADGSRISGLFERSAAKVFIASLRYNFPSNPPVVDHMVLLTKHTATSYPTAWSPNGDEVIFDNGDSGRSAIDGQKIESGSVKVYADTQKDAQGQFSPDGKWILFLQLAGNPERVQSIERVPAGGGVAVQLPVPGDIEEFHCSVSAAGACVVRETLDKKALVYYALDPLSGRGAELARTPWEPNVLGDWSLSPDGSTVAMAGHDPAHPAIQLIPVAPHSPHQGAEAFTPVAEIPFSGFGIVLQPAWSPDGKGFFVETHTPTGYALVYADRKGHATLLRQSPELIWAAPSRDGKRLAFPLPVLDRNIWVGLTHADVQH